MKRFANKVLLFVAVYLVVFSAAQYIAFLITGVEQTQLIESTFIVFGVECGGLIVKRIFDKRTEAKMAAVSDDEQHEDDDDIAG